MGSTPPYVAPQKLPSHWNEGKISPVVEHAKALQNSPRTPPPRSPVNQPS